MSLFSLVSEVETNDNLHLGRILILLKSFANKNNKGVIEGLDKLAELDFFLRYPVYLEKALPIRGLSSETAIVEDYERLSIEASAAYYSYKPWSLEYRRLVSILLAKELALVDVEANKVRIRLSPKGIELAEILSEENSYLTTEKRASLLKQKFNLASKTLLEFTYQNFPEVLTFRVLGDSN